MQQAATHPATGSQGAQASEAQLWLPPGRLRRYELNKVVGAVMISSIFVLWLVVQWSNPAVRWLAISCIAVTLWVTLSSIVQDRRRSAGRQLVYTKGQIAVQSPQGEARFSLSQVHRLEYLNVLEHEADAGLRFLAADGQVLAHLDEGFVTDEAEARTFVGWLRKQSQSNLQVDWNPRQPANPRRNAAIPEVNVIPKAGDS